MKQLINFTILDTKIESFKEMLATFDFTSSNRKDPNSKANKQTNQTKETRKRVQANQISK